MVSYQSSKYTTIDGINIAKNEGFAKDWDVRSLAYHSIWLQQVVDQGTDSFIKDLAATLKFSPKSLEILCMCRKTADDYSYVYKGMPHLISKLEQIANSINTYLANIEIRKQNILTYALDTINRNPNTQIHTLIQNECEKFYKVITDQKEIFFYDIEFQNILTQIQDKIDKELENISKNQ